MIDSDLQRPAGLEAVTMFIGSWHGFRNRSTPKIEGNQCLKSGLSAGSEAVMIARLVSIADVTNPIP